MTTSTPSGRGVLFCLGAGCGLGPGGCASAGAADMAAEAARNERRLKNGMLMLAALLLAAIGLLAHAEHCPIASATANVSADISADI